MMKRFYTTVSVADHNDGYCIMLDGRSVKTKSGDVLSTSVIGIADHVAEEWRAQGENIIPYTMPFTQILNTKIDRVLSHRAEMSAVLLKYLDTDMTCYPCAEPEELYDLQEKHWRPWRVWCGDTFGGVLLTTSGLSAVVQPKVLHDNIASYVHALSDDHFTLLQIIAGACGSLILALAFIDGRATVYDLYDASFVEENYKDTLYDSDKYGDDPLIHKKKKETKADLDSAFTYLNLL